MSTLSDYQRKIEKALAAGNATEHTHRPALKELVESIAPGITATNEPKRVQCGAPDYIVTRDETPLRVLEHSSTGSSTTFTSHSRATEEGSRYAEFLKIDFPRLPLTSNPDLFRALCDIGEELVRLHLIEKHSPLITRYPVGGNNTVETVRYTEPDQGADEGRVWINKTQYFDGVPSEVWTFHVGGYQVCQKWLKDRKSRQLTYDDLTHYQRIVAALAETIRLMAAIDETINEHGGWPLT